MNTGGVLDASSEVFKQAMNNYHSAKLGLFSESTGDMHELLFGGITLQQYLPDDPSADANGFVTDNALTNTNQITSVVRSDDGSYEQHDLGEYPELLANDGSRMRVGSNAEFFVDHEIATYKNGVIPLDLLHGLADVEGKVRLGYIFGGLIANAPHVFGNPVGLSSASCEVFEVVLTIRVPEPAGLSLLGLALATGARRRRCN